MLELSDHKWAEFKVGDIFDFTRGKRITTAFASENIGDIAVIAGGEQNNGILCYLDEACKTTRILKDSCITVAGANTTTNLSVKLLYRRFTLELITMETMVHL